MNKLELTENKYLGKLIVFEGVDGAGKTTMISLTYQYLKEKYPDRNIVLLKQPSERARNSELFKKMMFDKDHEDINYRAVQLLTLSDRIQQNSEIVIPLLKDNAIIICDRYLYTSIANMNGRNYKNENWFYDACKEIIKPNLTFLAFVEPEVAIKRIKSRESEKNRYFDEKLLYRASNEFLLLASSEAMTILDTSSSKYIPFNKIKEKLKEIGL